MESNSDSNNIKIPEVEVDEQFAKEVREMEKEPVYRLNLEELMKEREEYQRKLRMNKK